jgi:hypothetical protein
MGRPKKVITEPSPTESSDFQFFTEVDFNQHDRIGSMFPAYTNLSLIEDLKNEIYGAELALNSQNISPERRASVSKDLVVKKERLNIIENSRPKIDEKRLMGIKKDMEGLIRDSMFTDTEMKKGLADAHEEARRMVEKVIPISDDVANVLAGCNVKIDPDNKRVSRNDLTKGWKTIKKLFGENSNVEQLRRG